MDARKTSYMNLPVFSECFTDYTSEVSIIQAKANSERSEFLAGTWLLLRGQSNIAPPSKVSENTNANISNPQIPAFKTYIGWQHDTFYFYPSHVPHLLIVRFFESLRRFPNIKSKLKTLGLQSHCIISGFTDAPAIKQCALIMASLLSMRTLETIQFSLEKEGEWSIRKASRTTPQIVSTHVLPVQSLATTNFGFEYSRNVFGVLFNKLRRENHLSDYGIEGLSSPCRLSFGSQCTERR